jgi:diphosphomevalonate decarboxylase
MGASAVAHPNIALIKYWGNRDAALRLPSNGSISLTLGSIKTTASVEFGDHLSQDHLVIDGSEAKEHERHRVSIHLDLLREEAGSKRSAQVETSSNFPRGAGIASSASAFAAITLAGADALELPLSARELSILARQGSGSACRSIYGGFVEWPAGTQSDDSFAFQIAGEDHWSLVDIVVIVDAGEKPIGSSEGHARAGSSLLQVPRVSDAPRRLDQCRKAIQDRDFEALAHVAEADGIFMHAVMMTSRPAIHYWKADTLLLMQKTQQWRGQGVPVFFTIDAGPNVHCICAAEAQDQVLGLISEIGADWTAIACPPGPGAHLT